LAEVRKDGRSFERYRYDANGNRTSAIRDGQMLSARVGVGDEMLSQGSLALTYDAAGNLTSDSQGHRYTYDALGQLRRVTLPDGKVIEYAIDGLGRRIGKRLVGNYPFILV